MTVALAQPSFPPLMRGEPSGDPFTEACRRAEAGCDAGLILHDVRANRLRAALVLAPEVPLADAMAMLPICGIGFQNALGALAPPEVGVHLDWDGGLRVNGALAGRLSAAAASCAADEEPGWLVIGLDLALMLGLDAPGHAPDTTCLYEEGCGEVDPMHLLEAWARHTLVWINRWSDDGLRPIHAEWSGLAHGLNAEARAAGRSGSFVGVDDRFGMLLRQDDGSAVAVPLTEMLKGDRR